MNLLWATLLFTLPLAAEDLTVLSPGPDRVAPDHYLETWRVILNEPPPNR